MQVSGSADAKLTAMQAFTCFLALMLRTPEEADPAGDFACRTGRGRGRSKKLDALNRRRQQIEIKITGEARVLADAQADAPAYCGRLASRQHGIAAGRLAEV